MSDFTPRPTIKHIPELDGLRGLLAWWVVLSHILGACGFEGLPRGIRILGHGEYAVSVFIILSGFVIFKLLSEGCESFWVFITRRFLRLYPAYLVCIAITLATIPLCCGALSSKVPFLPPELAHWNAIQPHFLAHLLLHLTLLHGVIPDSILPYSKYALLGPAWSVSLEWQFYLIAPLAAGMVRRFGPTALLGVIASCVVANYFSAYSSMTAFLPVQLALFGVGMVSYALVANSQRRASGEIVAVAVAPLVLFFSWSISLTVWILSLGAVLADEKSRIAGGLRTLFNSSFIQQLGRISYSTYLGHYPCIFALQWLVFRLFPNLTPWQAFAMLLPSVAGVTWLLSHAVYRFVELPGIRLGRRFGGKFATSPTHASAAASMV